jgi:hypothetical protein
MAAAQLRDACTHLDQVKVHEFPASVDGCEECLRDGNDEVLFVLEGIRGTTRIPPSPLLS